MSKWLNLVSGLLITFKSWHGLEAEDHQANQIDSMIQCSAETLN